MKVQPECYPCLQNLTRQTLQLCSAQDPALRARNADLEKQLLAYLEKNFYRRVPAQLFTRIHEQIKASTGVRDAFSDRKHAEMAMAAAVAAPLYRRHGSLRRSLEFSVAGNSLDFFKPVACSAAEIRQPIHLRIDHRRIFEKKLAAARRLLFFTDNAGECFFDIPLITWLRRRIKLTYIVKTFPVQNDLTLADLRDSGIARCFPEIMGTGNGAVGIEPATISRTLRRALTDADLVIAKGMGYYETFSERRRYHAKLFHLFMAKCLPVARSISVPLNSYVFFHPG
ncbi:MAG: ARMT1-like domain-containing protein [Candidatus Omnitrophica bacterium]|nr:ARMT1-like domain-containing protein [Candidatus Omnitrophota bacterium]